MTHDDIIRMAIESGLYGGDPSQVSAGSILVTRLKRFGALVEAKAAAIEREECAQVAEWTDLHEGDHLKNSDPRKTCAEAIRARGAA